MHLPSLSNEDLMAELDAAVADEHRALGRVIADLAEVEERRPHLDAAYPSLFELCRQRFSMSDASASRKSNAARLVRRFPQLLPLIDRGENHLCTLLLLRERLNE